MFTVIHSTCGKPAFLLIEAPERGDVVKRNYARHLDRTRFTASEGVLCDSCAGFVKRENLSPMYLKRIRLHDRPKA